MGRFITILFALMLVGTVAHAQDRMITWDSGEFDVFDHQETQGHFIAVGPQSDWKRTFAQSLTFFGKTYGDVGELRASILVIGPQTDKTAKIEDSPDSPVIYSRKQFKITDFAGPDGAWVTVPLDPVEITAGCMVGIFTYSNDDRGLMIGLDHPSDVLSHSSYVAPSKTGSGAYDVIPRTDGRNWMMRLVVRPTLEAESTTTSADLTGNSFSAYDDGTADGFTTMQRYGPILRVRNTATRRVKRIWVYAFIDGDWFNTSSEAAVYLMDSRYAIVNHAQMPYSRFTDQPSWNYVSFPDVPVPDEFLVLIEPFSRPDMNFMIGYDNSEANQMSEFGSVGHAELGWPLDIPQDTTNWMIRVEYE